MKANAAKTRLPTLADDWRLGGSLIEDTAAPGQPRQAFNIMLSMPKGTDPLIVKRAAREFARAELLDHKYVMVPHDHQANPHVHISVRAESKHGWRLNPRKADLQRQRETFAEKLRTREHRDLGKSSRPQSPTSKGEQAWRLLGQRLQRTAVWLAESRAVAWPALRRLLGEGGIEQLLKATIDCAVDIKAVLPADPERVIVDSTVQSKAIAYSVESRLLETARHKVVGAASSHPARNRAPSLIESEQFNGGCLVAWTLPNGSGASNISHSSPQGTWLCGRALVRSRVWSRVRWRSAKFPIGKRTSA